MSFTVPYSVRITPVQRRFISEQAQQMKMSDAQWSRYQMFDNTNLTASYSGLITPQYDDKAIAQLLYFLGQSRIANNLNQLAKQANMGTLVMNPDGYHKIDQSYRGVQWMRSTLIQALGLKA